MAELIREAGISEQTFYRWKEQYIGLEVDPGSSAAAGAGRECALERLVAELILDKTMLQDVLAKKL